jgi:Zinc knuckle
MVLGNVGNDGSAPVCYYCNKPGHIKRDCYKFLAASRGGNTGGSRGSRGARGGRQGGRPGNGGRNLYNNAIGEGTVDVSEVMRLGMAAMANHQRQIAGEGRKVSFADSAT